MRVATLDRRVFFCVISLAILGVILALVFLSFNLYYRKFKIIKLSSPNLNNFVVVGCILVYIAVILLGVDHATLASDDHFPIVCSARAFLLSGGFSLAFGCMFIKTYRVYHIFIRTNTGIVKSKLLHDQQLLGMVSVLLLVDCVLVTLWVTVDPMERQLTNLSMQVNKEERNVVYLYLREHCNSEHMAKWLGSLYIYKGLLLVVGCYMAWETRHVKVPALNDSQYIGMSVYNVVITSIIVVALANVIPAERYTLTFVLVSTLIFVSTTATLCILFVPKIHTILINPEDGAIVATPGVKVECKTRRFALDEPRESLYRAEVLNRALKRELLELDEEYNRLAQKLGITPCEVRKSKLSEEQDEDSDDGLPPWLSEYKDYSSTGSDEVWYTGRPIGIIASAFTAIHHVALQATEFPSTSRCQQESNQKDSPLIDSKWNRRESWSKIDEEPKSHLRHPKPVRTFLSDRALNKLKIPETLRESAWDDNGMPLLEKKQLRSEPKLNATTRSQGDLVELALSLKQLPSLAYDYRSACSSEGSGDWTTAPLYTSTSYSTPPSDFLSSSNNGNNGYSRYASCEDNAGTEENVLLPPEGLDDASMAGSPEHSTFCGGSSGESDTNALSGSRSETTLSELSADKTELLPRQRTLGVPPSDRGSRDENLVNNNLEPPPNTFAEEERRDHLAKDNSVVDRAVIDNNRLSRKELSKTGPLPNEFAGNNNATESSLPTSNEYGREAQISHLRNQIFRLERELILLQLDQSEAIDL